MASIALLVTGCDDEEHRAVPPGTVREFASGVSDEPIETPEAEQGPAMLDDGVFGFNLPLAERIYFVHGSDIWQSPLEGSPSPVTDGEVVVDYSSSATGHRLALLRAERDESGDTERTILSLLLPDGTPLLDLSQFDPGLGFDQLSPIESIALSPNGGSLAMTHQNGALTTASIDGQLQQLLGPEDNRRPGRLTWSSDGRFIAYLDPWMPDEPSALYVAIPDNGIRQIMVEPSSSGQGVVRARWIPGTSYIAFVKSSRSTIAHGGDLFLLDVTTGEQELLVSSSEFAPVAGVVDIAPSPDGALVALTAYVPGSEYPGFGGLWLVDLRSGDRIEVDVSDAGSVTDLWWLGDRLLFRTIDEPRTRLPGTYTGQETFKLLEYVPETGEIEERYTDEETDEQDEEEESD